MPLAIYSHLYGTILKTCFELNNLRIRIRERNLRASLTSRHSLSHVQERQPRLDLGCGGYSSKIPVARSRYHL